jgi:hypothetical protein
MKYSLQVREIILTERWKPPEETSARQSMVDVPASEAEWVHRRPAGRLAALLVLPIDCCA